MQRSFNCNNFEQLIVNCGRFVVRLFVKIAKLVSLDTISRILLYTCLVALATRIRPQVYTAHIALQVRAHNSLHVIGEHYLSVIDL
jgi:hypothetical protein